MLIKINYVADTEHSRISMFTEHVLSIADGVPSI